jgi:hypothetical protein
MTQENLLSTSRRCRVGTPVESLTVFGGSGKRARITGVGVRPRSTTAHPRREPGLCGHRDEFLPGRLAHDYAPN